MSSDNPIGADNQQETRSKALDPGWVVGFVDGEGCFSVSIHRNDLARPTGGWHVQPAFQVSQHEDHRVSPRRTQCVLRLWQRFGKARQSIGRGLCGAQHIQLEERVIPFFEENELRIKHDDFEKFADIVRSIRSRAHHRPEEFDRIVRLAYSMNARGKQRKRPIEEILLGSSETVREAR